MIFNDIFFGAKKAEHTVPLHRHQHDPLSFDGGPWSYNLQRKETEKQTNDDCDCFYVCVRIVYIVFQCFSLASIRRARDSKRQTIVVRIRKYVRITQLHVCCRFFSLSFRWTHHLCVCSHRNCADSRTHHTHTTVRWHEWKNTMGKE